MKKKTTEKVLDLLLKKKYIHIYIYFIHMLLVKNFFLRLLSLAKWEFIVYYFYAGGSQLAALLILTFVERKYISFVLPVRDATS